MASVHIAKDITERKQVECEIQDIAKFPSENPNPVLRVQKDGKILYGNDAALPLLAKWKKKVGGVVPAKWRRLVDLTFESKKAINDEEEVDDKIFSFVVAPILDGGYANMYAIDVTERKQAEVELKTAQEKLIDTAHRAGMAEVAADVLHNVGNVLNSINVSTTVIREKVTSSEVANLEKVANIINEHTDDLGTFLTEDPQGKHIPVYLTEVSKCLQGEQTDIISRLWALVDNVQHIKDIVSAQQSYAKVSGVEVQTSLSKLVEDAIQINSAGLERHGTQLIREFEEFGDVEIDKQKFLQILVNLVSNAKYALSDSKREEKLLTIRIYKHGEDRFRIEVTDNGVGISEDNLAKIFSYGFTTKEHGHGVGLHSSALASKEMGGSLSVYSDGVGQGATFTLELPIKPVEVMK
jgi:signal transduction histidine kinase